MGETPGFCPGKSGERGRPGFPVRRVCPANLITMAGRLRRSKGLFEAVKGVV